MAVNSSESSNATSTNVTSASNAEQNVTTTIIQYINNTVTIVNNSTEGLDNLLAELDLLKQVFNNPTSLFLSSGLTELGSVWLWSTFVLFISSSLFFGWKVSNEENSVESHPFMQLFYVANVVYALGTATVNCVALVLVGVVQATLLWQWGTAVCTYHRCDSDSIRA